MIWALLFACADPCDATCDAAADAWGACLDARGAAWEDAGWADEADFRESCATWGWVQHRLARDAGVDGVCEDRTAEIRVLSDPCGVAGLDWDGAAWE